MLAERNVVRTQGEFKLLYDVHGFYMIENEDGRHTKKLYFDRYADAVEYLLQFAEKHTRRYHGRTRK